MVRTFPARKESLREVRSLVRRVAHRLKASADATDKLVVCVSEACANAIQNCRSHAFEKPARQHAVIVSCVATRNWRQIESGPVEIVELVEAEPLAVIVEAKLAGDPGGKLDASGFVIRR
jgi:hypothetical protein